MLELLNKTILINIIERKTKKTFKLNFFLKINNIDLSDQLFYLSIFDLKWLKCYIFVNGRFSEHSKIIFYLNRFGYDYMIHLLTLSGSPTRRIGNFMTT
ncbi:hypothetical protein BpHYR1_044386 [Brachionus plicatilis]|uniref:Uncharacterized protein n=1 Tax=Brachionus plicatilis TaxID=10195 RepID=A0A3M7SW76_BRAPC|nr:hypothetical protein BpHYR1_044386 [Brachionus plicatilis]